MTATLSRNTKRSSLPFRAVPHWPAGESRYWADGQGKGDTGLYASQWHLLLAASTVIILPVVLIFFVAQRYFVEGITMTGLKG